jgi:hypothetical protein
MSHLHLNENMNNICNTNSNNTNSSLGQTQRDEKKLLLIFLQLVQSRQKRLRTQRKNYSTLVPSLYSSEEANTVRAICQVKMSFVI